MLRLRTVCLAAVALAAGGFFVGRMLVAQDKTERPNRPGQRGGNFGLGKLALLKNADVQKDLGLTDEQKTTIEKFATDMQSGVRKQLEGLKDLSQEDRRAKLTEMRSKLGDREKEVQKKLDEVLNTSQRDRLGQIELQAELASHRVEVFAKKEIAEALGITDDQKQKLTELREKMSTDMREARGQGGQGGPPSEESRAKMKKITEEGMDKAKEILTSEQREKLEKMAGKKVDFDLSKLGGFGGGFGGRGGRRGGRGAGAPTNKTPEKSTDKPADKTTDKTPAKTDAASPSK